MQPITMPRSCRSAGRRYVESLEHSDNEEHDELEVAADESAPLLEQPHSGRREGTPLPRAQLAAVYVIKLTIPVASTQVQPYLNKMIFELDLPPGRPVGYYSGLIGLAINAGQFLTVFPWGRLSGMSLFSPRF